MGKTVGGRNDPLVDVFLRAPASTAIERARQLFAESALYNIGLSPRANLPLVALCFLQDTYLDTFEFRLEKPDPRSSEFVVTFKEIGRPTIIRGVEDTEQPTHGRFWIDRRSGAVRRSELKYEGPSAFSTVTTTFRADEAFGVLVSSEMVEDHSSPRTGRIAGRATYSRFRRFAVSTEETLR